MFFPALMRDNTKLVALGRATPIYAKAQIQVYSPAGEGLLLFSVWNVPLIHARGALTLFSYSVGTS
jgi:hypothetical protein